MAKNKKINGNGAAHVTIHQYSDAARLNIPEATQAKTDVPRAKKATYSYSPHLPPKLQFDSTGGWDEVQAITEKAIAGHALTPDEAEILRAVAHQGKLPWLEWANKQEQEGKRAFTVDDVVLHVHERVSAKAIITAAQRDEPDTQDFFARPKLHREQALQYYRHNVDWANRLILGDSLQVMSSLVTRENLAGKVQMIYIDPPYGISYKSNWQNELGKRTVGDKDEDLTREPEMIKAYRDTWTLGVHSYLAYLKQRLIIAHDLLKDGSNGSRAGSVFVQISDDNLHRVRAVMDEVFGAKNFVSVITVEKTQSQSSDELASVSDYLIWYSRSRANMAFNPIYLTKEVGGVGASGYTFAEDRMTGSTRSLAKEEITNADKIPSTLGILDGTPLISESGGLNSRFPVTFQGHPYTPKDNFWKTNEEGFRRLIAANRLIQLGTRIEYRRYLDDFPVFPLANLWTGLGERGFVGARLYVVQTAAKVIQRCMLMTTSPGDLVLDPTCGSGTTAQVAEQWGRRWITIDSSRVAIAIARQRLLTACFDSYKTKDPTAGVDPAAPQNPAHGFHYKTVPHITLRSIAQNRNLDPIFGKHDPILTSALSVLNAALAALADTALSLHSALVAKLKAKVASEGARAVTDADLRRWLLPGTDASAVTFGSANQRAKWKESIPHGPGWQEWEVPFDADSDWPQPLGDALNSYRKAWRTKMEEVTACISASAEQEELVDQPEVVRGVIRVSGPFSVEGVRPEELALGEDGKLYDPTANEFDDLGAANAEAYIDLMVNLLRKDGVTFLGNRHAEFASLEKEAGRSFHARGRWKGRDEGTDAVAVVFGPQYGPVNAPTTVEAIEAARGLKEVSDLVLAGFSFDAAAQEKAKEMDSPALRVHLAHIRPDVSPGMQRLLKQTPDSQLFTVFGQPEIHVRPAGDGEYKVEMDGVCVYNPLTGGISDCTNAKVAAWFLDADYDGRTFCFSQAFFPDKSAWEKITKVLGPSIPEAALQAFTTSWPFKPGKYNRIAVKVIDPRGNEVMAIKTLNT